MRIRIIPTETPKGLKYNLEVNGRIVHYNLDGTWIICNIRPKKGGFKLTRVYPKRCRYCGNMEPFGDEGSMKCKFDLKLESDEDAKTCPKFFYFIDK